MVDDALPLTLVMMSPGFKPARSPGLCGSTALISAPCGVAMPNDCASCWLDVLHRNADAAAVHLAVLEQLVLDVQCHIDGDREGHAHVAAGSAVNLRVDTDHLAIAG